MAWLIALLLLVGCTPAPPPTPAYTPLETPAPDPQTIAYVQAYQQALIRLLRAEADARRYHGAADRVREEWAFRARVRSALED